MKAFAKFTGTSSVKTKHAVKLIAHWEVCKAKTESGISTAKKSRMDTTVTSVVGLPPIGKWERIVA